jgi:hypothetical protein
MRTELPAKPREQCRPIHRMLTAIETELVHLVGNRLGIDGEARRIGAALGHAGQHRHHERAQPAAKSFVLHQETYDSTHAAAP